MGKFWPIPSQLAREHAQNSDLSERRFSVGENLVQHSGWAAWSQHEGRLGLVIPHPSPTVWLGVLLLRIKPSFLGASPCQISEKWTTAAENAWQIACLRPSQAAVFSNLQNTVFLGDKRHQSRKALQCTFLERNRSSLFQSFWRLPLAARPILNGALPAQPRAQSRPRPLMAMSCLAQPLARLLACCRTISVSINHRLTSVRCADTKLTLPLPTYPKTRLSRLGFFASVTTT